jgi:protein tyrosine/serine phosphatase
VDEEQLRWAHAIITDPANQPVLVHCARGTSRTGAVAAYYRIHNSNWPRQQIQDEMKQYAHRPLRNPGLEALIDRLFQSHQVAAQPRATRGS